MQKNHISTEKILASLQIKALNEMQLAALKANEDVDEVILLSSTGSGKTLAFLLPRQHLRWLLDRKSVV